MGNVFIFYVVVFYLHIDTEVEDLEYSANIKRISLLKVPDRKNSGCQQDLKALKSQQCYQILHVDGYVEYKTKIINLIGCFSLFTNSNE